MSHHGGTLFMIQPTFVFSKLPRPLSPDASTNEYGPLGFQNGLNENFKYLSFWNSQCLLR